MSHKYDEKQCIQTKCMNNFWNHCKYLLFHIDGTRFVCGNILYRAIEAGGRIIFIDNSFNLKNEKRIFFRLH